MKLTVALYIALAISAHAAAADLQTLAHDALSTDPSIAQTAIHQLRDAGPEGLLTLMDANQSAIQSYLSTPPLQARSAQPKELCNALDSISQQKDSITSGLYWYTDVEKAKAAARATGRPILSLRLLGKLTDEYSCANSRFFRTVLYANREVSSYLRDNFILHWESVRPVPRITIDFGDGRKLERTITGNSIHYILDSDGTPIDGIPGLYGPEAFLKQVNVAAIAAKNYMAQPAENRARFLAEYHNSQRTEALAKLRRELDREGLISTAVFPPAGIPAYSINNSIGSTPPSVNRSSTAGLIAGTLSTSAPSDLLLTTGPGYKLTLSSTLATPKQAVGAEAPIPSAVSSSYPTAALASTAALSKTAVERPLVRAVSLAPASSILESNNIDFKKLASDHLSESHLDEGSTRLMAMKNPSAAQAAQRAQYKTLVEAPLMQAIRNLEQSVAEDTVFNEYKLHVQLHEWFINGTAPSDLHELNEKVYSELFLTPSSDPWLGLAPADTYTALENEGLTIP